jgi:D-alanyl-D-alanine dipeptidase
VAQGAQQASRITPVRPIAELRAEALKAQPPVEPGPFDAPQLVELNKADSSIHLEIRYATSNNFLGEAVYEQARAFLQKPAAEALRRASNSLHWKGYGLLVYDAYRPWYVTKIFWEAVPVDKREFVADPAQGSSHNRGCAVDLTLYTLKTGAPVAMQSDYDEMSPRAYADYAGASVEEKQYRAILREAMKSEGFVQRPNEWWHYDYKDCQRYGILNLPFDRIAAAPFGVDGDVFSRPSLLQHSDAEYTKKARREHIEGTVVLSIVVDADGMPTDIQVKRSLGYGLDEEAIKAVKLWRFEPAKKDGAAVPVKVGVEINFRIQ